VFNDFGQPIGVSLPGWTPPAAPSRTPMAGRYSRLEPLSERFAPDLFAAASLDRDERAWTYLPYDRPASEDDYRQWLVATCLSDDPLFFAIVDGATGRAVGQASYLNIKPAQGSIEAGHIYFSPLARRSRVATDAMYLMMRRAFEAGYRRYEWKCDALNAPSRAAAEPRVHLRRHLPAGDGGQGPQSRHRVVRSHRQRMAGARVGVRGLAGAGELRRQRRAAPSLKSFR
jgi:RimJ/RimL family protein N-acetyltransferase